jgi:GTPase SAR1 family protein
MKINTYKEFYEYINKFEDDETNEKIEQILPHGSGINGDWDICNRENFWECKNYWDCINNNGYHDGFINFTVRIYKNENREFRIFINGNRSHDKNKKYDIKGYLEDTIHYVLKHNDIFNKKVGE